jgi:hypothetical protein
MLIRIFCLCAKNSEQTPAHDAGVGPETSTRAAPRASNPPAPSDVNRIKQRRLDSGASSSGSNDGSGSNPGELGAGVSRVKGASGGALCASDREVEKKGRWVWALRV